MDEINPTCDRPMKGDNSQQGIPANKKLFHERKSQLTKSTKFRGNQRKIIVGHFLPLTLPFLSNKY